MSNLSIFTSYWFYGDLETLISCYDNSYYYFINNYLDMMNVNGEVFELYFNYKPFHSIIERYKLCPFLECKALKRGQVNFNSKYLKNTLDNGWKILVHVDRSKIKHYGKNSIFHQVLIVDYDEVTQEVIFCDNSKTGKYRDDLTCTYDELVSAYESQDFISNSSEWYSEIYLLKAKCCESYDINLEQVIYSLKSYLGIPPYKPGIESELYDEYGGIESYKGLSNLIRLPYYEWASRFHIGTYSVHLDHKSLLLFALEIFRDRYGIPEKFIEECKIIKERLFLTRQLVIKYSIRPSNSLSVKISEDLIEIYKMERELVYEIVEFLKNVKSDGIIVE